ncbi:uncharacterized protein si:ch211-67f24.7 [Conger conger]|uniref:uncharacterized protein si:ch211-67f24.7 n=1 Tax=Conger conger TaxID=82655 RepID=UPI002A59BE22|nr:uncharacterized protein si:ch211-67f24.7 [Conger conger]
MKPQETQLIAELSELQAMVAELKAGFSSALLELSHIQQEDALLREDLEQTRQHCDRETLQLRALVGSLKTDLQEVRAQVSQLHKDQQKPQQADGRKGLGSTQTPGNSCACQACGGSQSDGTAPSPTQPASLLLHCYLQGLRSGLCPVTEDPVPHEPFLTSPCNPNNQQDSSVEAKRQQVVLDLFHSEQEYLSTLFQLYDKYKTLSALPKNQETCQAFVGHLEQLSQHSLLFRNTLEDRLHSKHWQGLVGDVFARLTCQNEGTFMGICLGYVRMLPIVLSHFHQSNGIRQSPQDSLQGRVSQHVAPVSRIHSYLTHIQDLLQWTGSDHPDHYWLQVSKRALRTFLDQCHQLLEEGGPQGHREKVGCSSSTPPVRPLSPSCQRNTGSKALTPSEHCEPASANRSEPDRNSDSANSIPASAHPGSRCPNPHGSVRNSHGQARVPSPPPPPHHSPVDRRFPRGASDPGGEERGSSPAWAPPPALGARGPGSHDLRGSFEDCDTDLDDLGDTSVFDYSSVTSCSPDGTLEMRERLAPGEGSLCLGKQVPRVPLHPPPGRPQTPYDGQPTPGPKTTKSNGDSASLISPAQPPPLRPFRSAWPASFQQRVHRDTETSREYKMSNGTTANPGRLWDQRGALGKGGLRSALGVVFSRAQRRGPQVSGHTGAWEDSEDSEGPCSTV